MLTFQEKALLVKLFYLNQQNSVAAVKEFRCVKQIRRGSMFPCALRKMIQKFETTGQPGILPGRGRKQIPSSSVEDVVIVVVEDNSQSPHGSVSVPVVSRVLDMPYSTVRKILRRILYIYPYKIKPVHQLQDGDSEVRTTFALEFLARMVVDVTWPWNILWSDKAHFFLNGHVNTRSCLIWVAENPQAIQEQPLHPDKVTVWYTATFVIGPYFSEEITANGTQTCSVTGNGAVIC
ncbi:hypothetical protein AVEN_241484-1 [Araneus ventricosus]|uniref:DUF4817 domain-containing protein n=1 Tax=Araneus ventricosus TaxID=182803 RepID=A0A4Y2FLH9_ARAVE|nr:hypothetical protein AVEN_241484-1 [Araneus ventricosus]